MLTAMEAFKCGFLARCVEDRLTSEQILTTVKRAADLLEKQAGIIDKAVDIGQGAVGGAFNYGVPLALAAPPLLGGLAGLSLAKATDIDDTDVADVKDRELLDEYRRQSGKLRRQKAIREYAKARQQTGRMFI